MSFFASINNVSPEQQALLDFLAAQDAADEKPDPTDRELIDKQFGPQQFDWTNIVTQHVADSLVAWEKATGQPEGMAEHVFGQFGGDLYNNINTELFKKTDARWGGGKGQNFLAINEAPTDQVSPLTLGSKWYTDTSEGVQALIDYAINFMGGRAGIQLSRAPSSGGGGGRRGPTAQDIRNQFDIEELSRAVDDMNRQLVFEPHSDPKRLARAYVEAVVKGKGEKNIDFATFVEQRIESTSRFKAIYRNKPEAMNARQYMAPYLQQANAVARPGDAADRAIGAAQFGATAEQFRSRLGREDAVTGSSSFINSLEGRLQDLNSVLKG